METFVLRIWIPSEDETEAATILRGFSEHARSGERVAFANGDELVAGLAALVREYTSPSASPGGSGQ